ncbi:phytanoyl-CoA dioxygenase family protein [Flavisolibacter nicotianae]|uniref:phytanoyl-CoA dioxygenase family protein n=1 Tax=Flavisolibacter nicotianae TaxID=2364882 RepID=UPI000EB17705|nr:phytanoyl-CoA dioxygenase family protein [Flavisolibacter nicotianae]
MAQDTQAILEELWRNSLQQKTVESSKWSELLQIINKQGKGLEETLRFLYGERPSLEAFLAWMVAENSVVQTDTHEVNALDENELAFFHEHGYVVLRDAVPPEQCRDAIAAILYHLGARLDAPSSWYNEQEDLRGLMVTFYHHTALQANRKAARIRKAFDQLYGQAPIHLVVDKVSFNPPETATFRFKGSPLHWDVSLSLPIPFKLQGLLYLNDVDEKMGAFHCVPGFHHQVESWLRKLPPGVNPRDEAVKTLQPVPVTGNAGDLVIWHQALPHCATANHGTVPRFVQYITYDPDNYVAQPVWI